jgi:hypothetical protein
MKEHVLSLAGNLHRWSLAIPTAAARLRMGKIGNKNRISLWPKQEYKPTKPTIGNKKGHHVVSNRSEGNLITERGTRNIVNSMAFGMAVIIYQCQGEVPQSVDFPRIAL